MTLPWQRLSNGNHAITRRGFEYIIAPTVDLPDETKEHWMLYILFASRDARGGYEFPEGTPNTLKNLKQMAEDHAEAAEVKL